MRQSRWLGPSLAVGHARERRRGAGARGSSGAKASGVTTPRRSMTCSPPSRRSWTPLGQQARWSRTRGGRGYDIDAVDLFLGQLFSHPGPGRDLGDVAQLSRTAPADLTDSSAGLARRRRRADATRGEDYFADECWNAWRDFGHQTCTRLWAERAGWRRELRTREKQTLASLRGFTWQNPGLRPGPGCQRCRAELYFHEREPRTRNRRYYAFTRRHRLEPGRCGPGAARPADNDAAGTSGCALFSSRAGGPRGRPAAYPRRGRGDTAGPLLRRANQRCRVAFARIEFRLR